MKLLRELCYPLQQLVNLCKNMNALIHLVFRKVSTEITNICILNLDVDSIVYINILQLKQILFFQE